jgi:hypothetical protein
VPREHPFLSTLKLGGFLGSNLWPAPARVHDDGFRFIFRTEQQIFQQDCYGVRTARPWIRP